MKQLGQCQCGKSQYEIHGEPLIRAHCHCTICQEFNHKDYSDFTVFRAKDISLIKDDVLAFEYFTQPPMVHRGACSQCGTAIIENINLPLMPKLTLVLRQALPVEIELPKVECHIFYHRRKAEVADNLPKYSGFIISQLSFTAKLLKALVASR